MGFMQPQNSTQFSHSQPAMEFSPNAVWSTSCPPLMIDQHTHTREPEASVPHSNMLYAALAGGGAFNIAAELKQAGTRDHPESLKRVPATTNC